MAQVSIVSNSFAIPAESRSFEKNYLDHLYPLFGEKCKEFLINNVYTGLLPLKGTPSKEKKHLEEQMEWAIGVLHVPSFDAFFQKLLQSLTEEGFAGFSYPNDSAPNYCLTSKLGSLIFITHHENMNRCSRDVAAPIDLVARFSVYGTREMLSHFDALLKRFTEKLSLDAIFAVAHESLLAGASQSDVVYDAFTHRYYEL